MKRVFPVWMLMGVLLLSVFMQPRLRAQIQIYDYSADSSVEKSDSFYTIKETDRILQQFTINTRDASTDDYLLEMARAGDLNVLADVTDVPTDSLPLSHFGQHRLSEFNFYNLIKGRNLTSVRIAENSFLYWPTIDANQLAKDILARKVAAARPIPPPLDAKQTNTLLTEYFQKVHGWDGKWEKVDIQVPVADLPPELRARVDAEIHEREITRSAYPRFSAGTSHSGVLDPKSEFWRRSRLTIDIGNRVPRSPFLPFLYLNRFEVTTPTGAYTVSGTKIGPVPSLDKK